MPGLLKRKGRSPLYLGRSTFQFIAHAAIVFSSLHHLGWSAISYVRDPNHDCCSVNRSLIWRKQGAGALNFATIFKEAERSDSYDFLLPKIQLRAGLSYYGSAIRLRKFVLDLTRGDRPLKVGVVGGSIAFGVGASVRGVGDWFSVFGAWLNTTTNATISFRNGGSPGTGSGYMSVCLQNYMDLDVDLLFIEYATNDRVHDTPLMNNLIVRNMERLLRRVLQLPRRPAVVFMMVPLVEPTSYEPFHFTSEDLEGALSAYYDVPAVSSRTALHHLAVLYPTEPAFAWNNTYRDRHPGDAGHKMMADLVVHLFQVTAMDLALNPFTEEEEAHLSKPFPPPMYRHNHEPDNPLCFVGDSLKEMATSTEGWDWVNEGTAEKPKWGFVSTTPGTKLHIGLGKWAAAKAPPDPNLPHHMKLFYLGSYENVGSAAVSCAQGCTCAEFSINAHCPGFWSQAEHKIFDVTIRDATCEVVVTVLNATSTGSYKFKVIGITSR